jgi:hypothetical protein
MIYARYDSGTTAGYGLSVGMSDTPGRLSFWSNNIGSWQDSDINVNDGKWHFVAVTGTGTTGTIYIDGLIDKTFTYSAPSSFSGNALIGINPNLSSNKYTGQIEELAIWDRALSATEIKNLYRKGVSRIDMNLYSCSDANCATKTSSRYLTNVINGVSTTITGLSTSRYLGFDAMFRPATSIGDQNAGAFWVTSFIRDVNIVG